MEPAGAVRMGLFCKWRELVGHGGARFGDVTSVSWASVPPTVFEVLWRRGGVVHEESVRQARTLAASYMLQLQMGRHSPRRVLLAYRRAFEERWAVVCPLPSPDGGALSFVAGVGSRRPCAVRRTVDMPTVFHDRVAKVLHAVETRCGVHVEQLGTNAVFGTEMLVVAGVDEGSVQAAFDELCASRKSWCGDLEVCVPDVDAAGEVLSVFVDNSNIHIGCQATPRPGAPLPPFARLKHKELVARVVRGRPCGIMFVGGGGMPDAVVRAWVSCGFRVKASVTDDYQANIDELLHSQIQRVLLETSVRGEKPGTLVLLTGDGNRNSHRSSFPSCVVSALKFGWRIELYAWKMSLSSTMRGIAALSKGRMTITCLDTWRDEITEPTGKARVHSDAKKEALLSVVAVLAGGAGAGAGGAGASLGAGAGGAGFAGVGAGASSPSSSPPLLPFHVVLAMCEEVVRRSMDGVHNGVLASALCPLFRTLHGCELQRVFCDARTGAQCRVQVKDILAESKVVHMRRVKDHPFYYIP
jgi:hypothetical protein